MEAVFRHTWTWGWSDTSKDLVWEPEVGDDLDIWLGIDLILFKATREQEVEKAFESSTYW